MAPPGVDTVYNHPIFESGKGCDDGYRVIEMDGATRC